MPIRKHEQCFAMWSNQWSINTLYDLTHDVFFVRDLNQDTATTGGFLQYGTTPIAGIQVGISYEGQWA
ncbi:MAG: hypothetical protein RR633_01990 [Acinetobacter sp.]